MLNGHQMPKLCFWSLVIRARKLSEWGAQGHSLENWPETASPSGASFFCTEGNTKIMWVTREWLVNRCKGSCREGDWVRGRTWHSIHSVTLTLVTKCRIHSVCNGHSAFCKRPVLSLFLSLLKGQQRPGCHPTLPPCSSDSSLLPLLAPTPIPPLGLPLPITYLSLGCLGVGTPIVNLNL